MNDNVKIVLVEPVRPANVGSVARAMNNMGFTELRLVNPCDYLSGEAFATAAHSQDILQSARVYPTLGAALADCRYVIGTSARARKQRARAIALPDLAERFARFSMERRMPANVKMLEDGESTTSIAQLPPALPADHRVQENGKALKDGESQSNIAQLPPALLAGVVFGRESSGLTNAETDLCNELVYIPAYGTSGSLNLSQAVLLVLYELVRANGVAAHEATAHEAAVHESASGAGVRAAANGVERLKERIIALLIRVGHIKGDLEATVRSRLSDYFGRSGPTERDVRMMHGMLNWIEKALRSDRQSR